MNVNWEKVQLGDVCDFQNGFAFKSNTFCDSGIPLLRISNIQNESVNADKLVFIDPKDYKEDLSKYKIFKDDLLIAMSGATTGKIGINHTEIEYLLNQRVGKFSPGKNLDKRFLYYFLFAKVEHNLAISVGSAQPNLSTQQIKEFQIPFPILSEQKRIVAILDEAFEGIDRAIANTEKNLTNARKLFEIYLDKIFIQKDVKWEKKKIDEIADVISGYSFKSEDFSDSHPLKSIKITNVGVREFIIESGNNLPETFAKTYDKFSVPKGSIVFALTRSIISGGLKVAVVPDDYHHALLNQRVAALKVNSHLMSEKFLFSYLCTQKAMAYVQSQVNTLMQPNLSINDLRRMIVPVPSLEEQNRIILRIAALSNKTQRLESLYQQKVSTNKNSLPSTNSNNPSSKKPSQANSPQTPLTKR
jgi:type I restriction enzyme, S subunit